MIFQKLCSVVCLFCALLTQAQKAQFTLQDTLRGSITPERIWWDVTHYELNLTVDPEKRSISGTNTIQYTVLQKQHTELQIDLQSPLHIDKVTQDGKVLAVRSQGNAHFITLLKKQKKRHKNTIIVHYSGQPKVAIQAPWDGGISWKKDANGNDFIASSCQGLGASVWWPNKDHLYDEPNSMDITVTVPNTLTNVSNGKLVNITATENTKTYHWHVNNPINNYGVSLNIGDYTHFTEKYKGEKDTLTLDYYVLKDHLEKAKTHFTIVPKMLKAFEHWFGPYPFYEDSYKLVETPYLGMEHQSAIAYGNQFQNGYLGRDLSGTGQGLKFDFIIIHESGHEWFGNSISCQDNADLWIHEAFTSYSESLFLEYYYGKVAATEYLIGTRKLIHNNRPIIGVYGVNNEGSEDMYFKGANIVHTVRQFAKDDEHWRAILRGMNTTFYHQTVNSAQIETYLSTQLKANLIPFFDQYLRTATIPVLEYRIEATTLHYRYTNTIPDFTMPVRIWTGSKSQWIYPTNAWKSKSIPTIATDTAMTIDPNFYLTSKLIP